LSELDSTVDGEVWDIWGEGSHEFWGSIRDRFFVTNFLDVVVDGKGDKNKNEKKKTTTTQL
jgi:hypothetical protein